MNIDLFTEYESAVVTGLVIFPVIKNSPYRNLKEVRMRIRRFQEFARGMQCASRIEFACEGGLPALWFFRKRIFSRKEELFCSYTFEDVDEGWCARALPFSEKPLRARFLVEKSDRRYPAGALVIEVEKKQRGVYEIFVDLFSLRASAG